MTIKILNVSFAMILQAVLRMTFWCGSGSADTCLSQMDPDPAIFVNDLQDANKTYFPKHFLLVTF